MDRLKAWSQRARVLLGRMDSISQNIDERQALSSDGIDDAEVSRIRIQLRGLLNDINALETDYAVLRSDALGDRMLSSHLKECESLLSNLQHRSKTAMNALRERGRPSGPSAGLQNQQRGASSSSGAHSMEAKLEEQERTMQEQDRDLERVHASVSSLLNISHAIHGELDAQDDMLAKMKRDLDNTHDGIEKTEQRTQDMQNKKNRCSVQ